MEPSDLITYEVHSGNGTTVVSSINRNEIGPIISERDSLKNALNSQSQRSNPIKSDNEIINQIQREISEKDKLISKLNQEVAKLRSKVPSTTGYPQSDIDAKNKTIRSLNSEISRLRSQIKEKDRLINALNEQIGVN